MGGIDLCDRMLSFYRIGAKSRKWTIRTIIHFFDVVAVNAWIQFRKDQTRQGESRKHKLEFLSFKIRLAEALMAEDGSNSSDESSSDEPAAKCVPLPAEPFRVVSAKYLLRAVNIKNHTNCHHPNCSARTCVKCIECNLFLCVLPERNCFEDFHKKLCDRNTGTVFS